MKKYRKTSHSIYDIKFHFIWITKYRKPMLSGSIGKRLRILIREICKTMDIEIIKGHVSKDHVHLFVSMLPYHSVSQVMKRITVSQVMKRIKGKTSKRLLSKNRILAKQCWGRILWARGYFSASSGNVIDDVIVQYIEQQAVEERTRDEDFTIDT